MQCGHKATSYTVLSLGAGQSAEGPATNTCLVLSSTPAGLIYSARASLCMDNLHNSAKPLIAGRSSAYLGSWQERMPLSFQAFERV